jgi:predicted HicB family RNase H-like nuclease
MNSKLSYKGYTAHVEFDAEDRLFFGRLDGIIDIVTFHGESVEELVRAFEEAVDAYLLMSEQLGRRPQTPYSGRISLRLPPAAHAKAATRAAQEGKSLTRWLQEQVLRAVEQTSTVASPR